MYDDTFTAYPSSLTREETEDAIVFERLHLYNQLKPCGASALRMHLKSLGVNCLPSLRTIGRILSKQSLTHGRTGYYAEDYR
jgi:hypothetical protein